MRKKMQPATKLVRPTAWTIKGGTMDGGTTVVAAIGTLIPIAGIAFAGFVVWLGVRLKEREALNRNELLRKIAESQGDAAQKVFEMLRQQDNAAQIRRREGLKLGGLITLAVGLALMIFLYMIERSEPVWAVGTIPALVGAVLILYVLFLAPKPKPE
jgi:hypothetical protein